jgi:hypothetical protein
VLAARVVEVLVLEVARVASGGPVVRVGLAELAVRVDRVALAELAVRVDRVALGELAVRVDRVALGELVDQVASVAPANRVASGEPANRVARVALELAPVAVALRTKWVTAAHHRGLVAVPKVEDSAAVAETTREQAATGAAAAWAAAV